MSEEGYKPTAEEILKAEDTMTERQEHLSLDLEEVSQHLVKMGIKEEYILPAIKSFKWSTDTNFEATINGHRISSIKGKGGVPVWLDGVRVDDDYETDRLSKILHKIKEVAENLNSPENETERIVSDKKQIEKMDAALKDIFG